LAESGNWLGMMGDIPSSVAESVSSHCGITTCFDTVLTQLQDEIAIVAKLNVWDEMYIFLQDQVSQSLIDYLSSAASVISVSSTTNVKPSNGDSSWFSSFLDVLNLVATYAEAIDGLPAALINSLTIAGATGTFVNGIVSSGGRSTSTGSINFSENAMMDLEYSEMVDYLKQTYDNLNQVAANQVSAISRNWGKLQAFNSDVYDKDGTPSEADISKYIAEMGSFFEWMGYQWLFNSKYRVCYDVDYHLKSPSCDSDHAPVRASKSLGETKRSTCTMGGCDDEGTCTVTAYTYIATLSSCSHFPQTSVTDLLSNNTYAVTSGLIDSSGFSQTVVDTCNYKASNSTCTAAGMAFEIHNQGNCRYEDVECSSDTIGYETRRGLRGEGLPVDLLPLGEERFQFN